MPARDLSEREADALASMMGADSRRIDDLAQRISVWNLSDDH